MSAKALDVNGNCEDARTKMPNITKQLQYAFIACTINNSEQDISNSSAFGFNVTDIILFPKTQIAVAL